MGTNNAKDCRPVDAKKANDGRVSDAGCVGEQVMLREVRTEGLDAGRLAHEMHTGGISEAQLPHMGCKGSISEDELPHKLLVDGISETQLSHAMRTCSDRELVIRAIEDMTGEKRVYHPLPRFEYSVGGYTLRRDGCIVYKNGSDAGGSDAVSACKESRDSSRVTIDGSRATANSTKATINDLQVTNASPNSYACEAAEVFEKLASLGLCDYAFEPDPPNDDDITYEMECHSGDSLYRLAGIISARQLLINNALDARGAFYIAPELMRSLAAHTPETVPEFLQALYGRDSEYKGLEFTLSHIVFTGFRKCSAEERHIHRQLADLIVKAALGQEWVKPFTHNVRNRKYAFRTWLNTIGMTGEEYEEARQVMLGRLYGRADQKKIVR